MNENTEATRRFLAKEETAAEIERILREGTNRLTRSWVI
jgi:hypothetical protein